MFPYIWSKYHQIMMLAPRRHRRINYNQILLLIFSKIPNFFKFPIPNNNNKIIIIIVTFYCSSKLILANDLVISCLTASLYFFCSFSSSEICLNSWYFSSSSCSALKAFSWYSYKKKKNTIKLLKSLLGFIFLNCREF